MILTVTYTIMAALQAGLQTLMEYLSAHVLTCLIPAFFIAGGIAALLKTEMVLKYFGADAPKWICYSVAATSGTILAVCSCTILPMFAGIEKKGAGIGPATAFLFSGPAINLLAIVLTARVLGLDLGIARAVAAVSMAVIIGLIMAAIFERNRKCEISSNNATTQATMETTELQESGRTERISILFLGLLIGVLLSATSKLEFALKWTIVAAFVAAAAYVLIRYFSSDEKSAFFSETWSLAKKIFPLLVVGTFITGIIGYFMPVELLRTYLGSNSFWSCFIASIVGALLYMPTLLEVPIVGTLFGYSSGITAAGPALSLLLAGPSLSLPSMIVITRIIGLKKGGVYISLVVIVSTIVGMLYGAIVG
ncbi:MAG: permease [Methanosaeta sp. NSM2]|nr:permease [Methanothrix sp.]OYV12509.1 MAG: permease [Methanosaeta sp. NSM2]